VAGLTFYSDGSCGTPATTATFAAGSSTTSFWFRGTAVGSPAATAAVAGWTASATQTETVTQAATDHFVWDPIPSPQGQDIAFGVTVRALDFYGNPTPSFTGTATLSIAPATPLTCASGCTSGLLTGAFAAGIWTGSVSVGGGATGAALTATAGAVAGTSNAFDVQIPLSPSPPIARFTATPLVIRAGQSVSFDASASSDYETPAGSLQVSWDFQGGSTATPTYPAPAAPWTAWTTTKTASNTYAAAGTYAVHLAVRDAAGDLGFATVTVVVLTAGATNVCIVNTSADLDDGATSCTNSAQFGTDGKLSLVEALKIATDGWTIYFASPMTITGSGSYTIARKVRIVAQPGVVLDTKALSITGGDAGTPVSITGLEMTRLAMPVAVQNKKGLLLQDVYLHDGAGISDAGTLTLIRVRMARCTTRCVEVTDASGADTLKVRYSDFRGAAGTVGIQFTQCAAGKLALVAQSNAFSGFQTAIEQTNTCSGFTQILANTFEANGTAVSYYNGALNSFTHVLQNNVFTNQSVAAVDCGGATTTFTTRNYHQLFQNASAGCIGADPFTLSPQDPYYVLSAGRDYRLNHFIPAGKPGAGSINPAIDSAFDAGTLYFLPAYPASNPRFLGLGPDRGGRESY
jgi:PKD repeat protein